jgi:hypothetical protein
MHACRPMHRLAHGWLSHQPSRALALELALRWSEGLLHQVHTAEGHGECVGSELRRTQQPVEYHLRKYEHVNKYLCQIFVSQ